MAQCYCSLFSEYPSVDTGRGTVSIQDTHRRLRDYKQTLISSVAKTMMAGDGWWVAIPAGSALLTSLFCSE